MREVVTICTQSPKTTRECFEYPRVKSVVNISNLKSHLEHTQGLLQALSLGSIPTQFKIHVQLRENLYNTWHAYSKHLLLIVASSKKKIRSSLSNLFGFVKVKSAYEPCGPSDWRSQDAFYVQTNYFSLCVAEDAFRWLVRLDAKCGLYPSLYKRRIYN